MIRYCEYSRTSTLIKTILREKLGVQSFSVQNIVILRYTNELALLARMQDSFELLPLSSPSTSRFLGLSLLRIQD